MKLLRWIGLVLLVVAAIAVALSPYVFDNQPVTLLGILNATSLWYVVPGLVVMAKRPWHQVGWLLLLLSLLPAWAIWVWLTRKSYRPTGRMQSSTLEPIRLRGRASLFPWLASLPLLVVGIIY